MGGWVWCLSQGEGEVRGAKYVRTRRSGERERERGDRERQTGDRERDRQTDRKQTNRQTERERQRERERVRESKRMRTQERDRGTECVVCEGATNFGQYFCVNVCVYFR